MFIKFQCGCGHKFRTQPQNAGKKIVCPNCLVKVVIPDPDADSPRLSESEDAVSRNPDAKSPLRGKAATPEIPSRANDRKLAADDDDSRKEAQQRKKRKIKAETPADLDSNSFDLSNVGPMEAEAEAIDDDENVEEFESLRPRKRKTAAGKGDNKSAKKSDKKKPTNREPRKMTGVLIGGLIAGVVLMGIVGFVVVPPLIRNGAGGKKAKAPLEYEKFEDHDISLRCEIPKGWEADARGGEGSIPPSLRIESGRIKILYRASISGTAIHDIVSSGANLMGSSDDSKPIARVHEYQRQKFADELSNYKEFGEPETIDTGWGEGRLSTYTASGSFGSSIYGYRITLITSKYQWNVTCQCPTKREFDAYKDVFRRVVSSTGR